MSTHDLIRATVIRHAITPEQIAIALFRSSRKWEFPPTLKWCHQHVCAGLSGDIGISGAMAYLVICLEVGNKDMNFAAPMG